LCVEIRNPVGASGRRKNKKKIERQEKNKQKKREINKLDGDLCLVPSV